MKAVVLATELELALTRLCGIPLIRRLLYTLRAAGLGDVIIVTGSDGRLKEAIGNGGDLGMRLSYCAPYQLGEMLQGPFLAIEANYVLDERIIKKLTEAEGMAVAYDSGRGVASLRPYLGGGVQVLVEGDWLQGMGPDLGESNGMYVGAALCQAEALSLLTGGGEWFERLAEIAKEKRVAALDMAKIEPYMAGMRRKVKPFWFRIDSEDDARFCKRMLVKGAQKRTLDVLAWYFNRPIENWITYHIADFPITPNQMSFLTYIVAFSVTFLLLHGQLLPASLLTFAVNVMDGLDGKLARVKGMATKLGHLEHSFDLLYEQSWYIALAWIVHRLWGDPLPLVIGFAAVLFDSFARHVSMQFKQVMGVSLADYAPFDRRFRRFDGRRNIYTIYILLGVLFGVPLYALAAIAGHAFITGAVYVIRAAKHLHAADMGAIS